MHGSLDFVQKLSKQCDPHQLEVNSGRSALHRAAFWGHESVVKYLLDECKLDANVQVLWAQCGRYFWQLFGGMPTANAEG